METIRPKTYRYFVGTDVSKYKLDFAVRQGKLLVFHREIPNEAGAIAAFIAGLKSLPGFRVGNAVFCMEFTGIYCHPLLAGLKRVKANIVCVGSEHIRQSIGKVRGKNDKIDAMRIAEYAYTQRDSLRMFVPKRTVLARLGVLSALRARLIGLQTALRIPLKEQRDFFKKGMSREETRLCARSAAALKLDIREVEERIAGTIRSDERLARLMAVMTSVTAVGPVTALAILLATNEFRNIRDPRKFACYAGVAPFKHESGQVSARGRVSHFANKKMKSLLHTCALTARRAVPELKAYFERKTAGEGKNKMLVLNNIRYKLILRVFACVRQDRYYEADHVGVTPGRNPGQCV